MGQDVNRRDFLQTLGITVGAAALGATGGSTAPNQAEAQAKEPPKGTIPDKPIKIGHMTFFTGPGAVLGEPSYKGHLLVSVLMLLLVILTGLWGNQQPLHNLAPTLVWEIWWVGLAYVSVLVRNLWAVLNPWQALFIWAERFYRYLRPNRALSWHLPYPQAEG